MNVLATGSLCLILGLGGWWQGTANPAKDEAAIRDVVKEYVGARERQDPAAVGALFTSDADQLVSSGEWRRGREALVKGTLASSRAYRRQPHDHASRPSASPRATWRSPTGATRSPAALAAIAACGQPS